MHKVYYTKADTYVVYAKRIDGRDLLQIDAT